MAQNSNRNWPVFMTNVSRDREAVVYLSLKVSVVVVHTYVKSVGCVCSGVD